MTVEEARRDLKETLYQMGEDGFVDVGILLDEIEALIDARAQKAIDEAIDGLQANGYIPV